MERLTAGLPYLSVVTLAFPPRTLLVINKLLLASRNDKTAVDEIVSLASSALVTPANFILIRLSPSIVISGSLTPKISILFRIAL